MISGARVGSLGLEAEDLLIETCAIRAWPAEVVEQRDNWLLRATAGVNRRRSNSAVPLIGHGRPQFASMELFYRERGLSPTVQVSPEDRLRDLDGALADRGYGLRAPTLVLRADVEDRPNTAEWPVVLDDGPLRWLAAAVDAESITSTRSIIERIPAKTIFATVLDRDRVVGAGAGVLDGELLGVFGMSTSPAHRGCGVASSVLKALLDFGRRAGVRTAWLQVEQANDTALRLYRRHGFERSHGYHYRVA